jgi:hypothetical protein
MTTTALATREASNLPTPAEWNGYVAQAEALAQTEIVPKPFRGKPHDIIAVSMIGRELGLSPMMAMQYIHVIDGKPAMSAELMNARVRMAGHSIKLVDLTSESCTIVGTRRDTGESQQVTYTMADAVQAGVTTTSSGKPGNWQKVPKPMLWARCISMLCRMLFPDVIAGASYVPEELGAEVTEDGTPVNAQAPTVALPAGLAEQVAAAPVQTAAPIQQVEDVTDVEVIAEEYAQPAPPPPLTPEQEHEKRGRELFPRGWPMGSDKGTDCMQVSVSSLTYFHDNADVTHPQYGAKNRNQAEWCRAELARREALDNPNPQAPGRSVNAPRENAELDEAAAAAMDRDLEPAALPVDPNTLGLMELPDNMTLSPLAAEQLARGMVKYGYATDITHAAQLLAQNPGMTAKRARENAASMKANPGPAAKL